jgi:hypothetical protein
MGYTVNGASEQDKPTEAVTAERSMTPPHVEVFTEATLLQSSPELTEPATSPMKKQSKVVKLRYSGPKPPFTQSEAVIPQELAAAPVVKRRRGRPPKNAQTIAPPVTLQPTVAEPRRRRGRQPRKQPEHVSIPVKELSVSHTSPPPALSTSIRRGRAQGARTQPNPLPAASPVKRRGRQPKSTEFIQDGDSDNEDFAPASKKFATEKAKTTQRAGRKRQTPTYEAEPSESELSSVESSEHDGDFVDEDDVVLTNSRKKSDPVRKERPLPPRGGRSLRQRTKKRYTELSPTYGLSDEESEEESIAPDQHGIKSKSSEVLKPSEKSPSSRSSISPLARTPTPKPIEGSNRISTEKLTTSDRLSKPAEKDARGKKGEDQQALAKELFGSDSEGDEDEQRNGTPESTKQEKVCVVALPS